MDPVCRCEHGEPLDPSNPHCASHGEHHCRSCKSGFWLDGKVCTTCPIGHECENSVKTPCGSASRYSEATGASQCKTCADGSFTSGGAGASTRTSCTLCPAGHACAGGLRATCGEDSKYAAAGLASCSLCPAGSTTGTHAWLPAAEVGSATTRRVCRKCPHGHTCDGTSNITACSAGYFAAGGNANCIPCGNDKQYSAQAGAGSPGRRTGGVRGAGQLAPALASRPTGSGSTSTGQLAN